MKIKRAIAIHISPNGVRCVEGENRNGSPSKLKPFTVYGVSDFFSSSPYDNSCIVTNMSGLVSSIVTEIKNRGISSRNVVIASDCIGISTNLDVSDFDLIGTLFHGDVKDVFKNIDFGRSDLSPGQIAIKNKVGIRHEDRKPITLEMVADKFTLQSLVLEFYKHGFTVLGITSTVNALISLRVTESATFDSQGKIIMDFSDDISIICMKRDTPVSIKHYSNVLDDAILSNLDQMVISAIEITGRSPMFYITGTRMSNMELYRDVVKHLELHDYIVYDLLQVREKGDSEIKLTPDYLTAVSLFISSFDKTSSFKLQVGLTPRLQNNSKTLAVVAAVLTTVAFISTGAFAGYRFYRVNDIESKPNPASSIRNSITSLRSQQASLNSTIETLSEADTTVMELLKFVQANQTPDVTVVSIDTTDMLSGEITVTDSSTEQSESEPEEQTDTGETPEDSIVTGGSPTVSYRSPILVRGYAKTGHGALSYFDSLFAFQSASSPVLNGLERYTLPNGEEVYIFEIMIGGN